MWNQDDVLGRARSLDKRNRKLKFLAITTKSTYICFLSESARHRKANGKSGEESGYRVLDMEKDSEVVLSSFPKVHGWQKRPMSSGNEILLFRVLWRHCHLRSASLAG